MKTICKVLKPFTEEGVVYQAGGTAVLDRERALQMGDLILIQREIKEKVKVIEKSEVRRKKGNK